MPLYEYQCECKSEREVLLPFHDTQPQVCECGKAMQRKVSVSSFVMKQTGRGMALDTLNGDAPGMPKRTWTADAEIAAAAGL